MTDAERDADADSGVLSSCFGSFEILLLAGQRSKSKVTSNYDLSPLDHYVIISIILYVICIHFF